MWSAFGTSRRRCCTKKSKYEAEEMRGEAAYRMHDTDMRLASQTAHKRKSNTLEHTAGANRKRYSGAMELQIQIQRYYRYFGGA